MLYDVLGEKSRRSTPKYKVVILGIRGSGKLSAPKTEADYSVPIFAEDVLGLLNLLGIGKCCLVGHSIGGLIALQFALSYPDRLAGLVLVDIPSGPSGEPPKYTDLHRKWGEIARSKGLEAVFEDEISHNPLTIEKFRKNPEAREVARQRLMKTSVNGYIFIPRAISKWQLVKSRLSEIRVATLIYYGDQDHFPEAAKIAKEGIVASVLITLQGVGHNPHMEVPTIFNEALLKFLERVNW